MIRLEEISKSFGKFKLENINIHIPKGYICGLVGPNGAGKTTLLNILLGLYQPDNGSVAIDGMTFEENEKKIHDETGVVLVDELFDPSVSIIKNANRYGRFFSKYSEAEMEKYLELFRLDGRKKFKRLSKGEKLKAQFAFALSHDAKILILDEPTANFDPDFREEFLRILKMFIADGERSVILATHLTDDLDMLADYLIYLDKGNQVFAGDIESFREKYKLVSGEKYKINLIKTDSIIHVEENKFGTNALVDNEKIREYDNSLEITNPTIEQFMYYYTKGSGAGR